MLSELAKFFISSIIGLIIAFLLLLGGLLFTPDSWTIKVISFLKPKLLNKTKSLFRSVINLFVYNNLTVGVYNKNVESQLINIHEAKNELEKLEKSSFFIDSIIGIFEMLSFILYTNPDNTQLYESTAEYFDAYCTCLFQLEDKELKHKLQDQFYEFSTKIDEISNKYGGISADKPKNIQDKSVEQRDTVNEFSVFLNQLKQDNAKKILNKRANIINASDIVVEEVRL